MALAMQFGGAQVTAKVNVKRQLKGKTTTLQMLSAEQMFTHANTSQQTLTSNISTLEFVTELNVPMTKRV